MVGQLQTFNQFAFVKVVQRTSFLHKLMPACEMSKSQLEFHLPDTTALIVCPTKSSQIPIICPCLRCIMCWIGLGRQSIGRFPPGNFHHLGWSPFGTPRRPFARQVFLHLRASAGRALKANAAGQQEGAKTPRLFSRGLSVKTNNLGPRCSKQVQVFL